MNRDHNSQVRLNCHHPLRLEKCQQQIADALRLVMLDPVSRALEIGDALQAFGPGSERFTSQSERSAFLGNKLVA